MRSTLAVSSIVLVALGSFRALCQAVPTATQRLQISVFSGLSGVYTGLESGRNVGITAGVDFGIRPVYHLFPSIEIRGTYPFAKGQVDNQRNVLGGVKFAKHYGHIRPYADFLFGRGEIQYPHGYDTPSRAFFYVQSTSNLVSPGFGVDLELNDRFAVKADGQFQRYASPVAASGHAIAKSVTVGLAYRFSFERTRR